jgi:hypothetical protein
MEETSYDPGIAGSIIFSSLTVGVILLLISFYRRYKRFQIGNEAGNEAGNENSPR